MRKNNQKNKTNATNATFVALAGLVSLTTVSGLVLTTTKVAADDVVDNVSITVPVSCTMTGTISSGNEHTAEIANGTYQANIGTTSIKTICNDNAGFSIYAIGNSGDTLGEEDSTKLLGTSASGNAKIVTGTATTAGNPDVSNWAMKVATDSQATYPLTIQSDTEGSFSSYHTVPSEYTKVATRLSGTDTGSNAAGSTLATTYAAYISKTQAADTYSGKVKYVLVHPNDGAAPEIPIVTGGIYTNNIPLEEEFVYIGQEIGEDITIYQTGAEAMDAWSTVYGRPIKPYYLRHKLDSNNVVEKSFVEFVVTSEMAASNPGMQAGTYTLQGGIDESALPEEDRTVYERNKTIITRAFGNNSECAEDDDRYYCYNSQYDLFAEIWVNGGTIVGDSDGDYPHCEIYAGEEVFSYCYS